MKKSNFYYIILTSIFIIFAYKLIIIHNNKNNYIEKRNSKTTITILGSDAPRGRILDTNGKVLVDNKKVKAIYYMKYDNNKEKEIDIANTLSEYLIVKEPTLLEQKEYYLACNNNGEDLITTEEYELLQKRKINSKDIYELKLSRIDENMLSKENNKAAKIYSLMQQGNKYDKKLIAKDISDDAYAQIMELNIPGISGELIWERYYPYGDTLKYIFGSVGNIPKEKKDEYLARGYQLNDLVGTSYLEYQYEDYLKGNKGIYELDNNKLVLKVKEEKGNDLVLAIDIDLQQYIDNVIKEVLNDSIKYQNTDYYNETYVLVGNPNNGEILAISGIRKNKDGSFSDVSLNNINKSFTMGSAVKGATIAVGYKYNLIDLDKYITDSCVKLEHIPLKCSHKRLGKINDLLALQESSNYYQYLIAIASTGNTYKYNMNLFVTEEDFMRYRSILSSFGLGSKTGIDLPNESTGIIGSKIAPDLLLNLAIGQYDTYTPIEMLQYINSIASGKRMSLSLMRNITSKEDIIVEHEFNILNDLPINEEYLNRIREGMRLVISKGTGRYSIPSDIPFAGKTGTSESFLDTNGDGIIDIPTITKTFVGFYPYDNPKYSLVVIAPNISYKNGEYTSIYNGASKISKKIATYLKNRDF